MAPSDSSAFALGFSRIGEVYGHEAHRVVLGLALGRSDSLASWPNLGSGLVPLLLNQTF
jgi:hypothetical protein